ncbi:MAG TPA: hypothetical protein VK390_01605 [Propionibacteriaceae bacterium]|nr:hypothetical protein [Propionibacteriaceae bacterium]
MSGLGHQETADEHGPPAQPVDDKQRDDVTEPGAATSELQGRRQLAEREYRLTSRLRQRGHGEKLDAPTHGHARVAGRVVLEEGGAPAEIDE